MGRTDPITDDEWNRIRAALKPVLAKMSFGTDEYRAGAEERYGVLMDTMWEIGCHPSVFSDLAAHQFQVKTQDGDLIAQWKRPKTKNWCQMPLTDELAARLRAHLESGAKISRKRAWEVLKSCATEADVEGVTPLTIRHTVGFRIFQALGPHVAKQSLQVGDRALQHYTSLSSGSRLKALRQLRKAISPA